MQQRKHRPLAARTLNRPRHTGEKQWPNELVRPRKSLTEEPDNLSGKRPTKTKVLVVYRRGFVRSGVLSLIAKAWDLQSAPEPRRRRVHPVVLLASARQD